MKKPGQKNRVLRTLAVLAAHAAGIGTVVWFAFNIGCPIRRFFGVPCPSCGISRAYTLLFQGDLRAAFYYFPLFLIVPPVLFLLAHQKLLRIRLSKKATLAIGLGLLGLLIVLYVLRVFVFKLPFLAPNFEQSVLYRLLNR